MPLSSRGVAQRPPDDTIVAQNTPAGPSIGSPHPSAALFQWFSIVRTGNPTGLVQYVTFVAIYHIAVAKGRIQADASGRLARKG